MHVRSSCEYHLLTNHARQRSVSRRHSCVMRGYVFILSEIYFFSIIVIWFIAEMSVSSSKIQQIVKLQTQITVFWFFLKISNKVQLERKTKVKSLMGTQIFIIWKQFLRHFRKWKKLEIMFCLNEKADSLNKRGRCIYLKKVNIVLNIPYST